MARIKIENLPVLEEMEVKETKGIFGGALNAYEPEYDLKTSYDSTSDAPMEVTSINYEEVEWTYREEDDGSGDNVEPVYKT